MNLVQITDLKGKRRVGLVAADRIVLLKPLPATNTSAAPLGAPPETPAGSPTPTP